MTLAAAPDAFSARLARVLALCEAKSAHAGNPNHDALGRFASTGHAPKRPHAYDPAHRTGPGADAHRRRTRKVRGRKHAELVGRINEHRSAVAGKIREERRRAEARRGRERDAHERSKGRDRERLAKDHERDLQRSHREHERRLGRATTPEGRAESDRLHAGSVAYKRGKYDAERQSLDRRHAEADAGLAHGHASERAAERRRHAYDAQAAREHHRDVETQHLRRKLDRRHERAGV